MYWLASSAFQLAPPSSERNNPLFFDSIIAYTTCGLDGATATAMRPYGLAGRPLLLAWISSLQCSPPSVDLNSPLPDPPERQDQPCRPQAHEQASTVRADT